MRDPFPFAAPAALSKLVQPLADALDLKMLPQHIHEILIAAAAYFVVCAYISPVVSAWLFPRRYKAFDRRTRLNWDVHVTSLVQSTLISSLALYVVIADPARGHHPQSADGIHASPHYAGQIVDSVHGLPDFRQRIWGYTPFEGLIQSLSTGYFLWDLYISLRYMSVFGPGLLAHAIAALYVYTAGYRPFTVHYAPIFILYEVSSPFLNIHWFCDKLGLTGSSLQLYNGVLLIATFFAARLVWGVYYSLHAFVDMYRALQYQDTRLGKAWLYSTDHSPVQWWLALSYVGSSLMLTALNVVWFGKMIATIRARFAPPFGTRVGGAGGKEAVKQAVDAAPREEIVLGRAGEASARSTGTPATATRSRRKA